MARRGVAQREGHLGGGTFLSEAEALEAAGLSE